MGILHFLLINVPPSHFYLLYIKRLCAVDFFKSVYYTGYSLLLFLALS